MLQLNDDILQIVFFIVCRDPQDIFNLRGVCKRFQSISEDRSLWRGVYTIGGLERGFGPPSWHTTLALQDHIVRYHRINRNLESGNPKFVHRTFNFHFVNDGPFFMHGRFAFFKRDPFLVCFDMADELKMVWKHHDPSKPWNIVEVRNCEIKNTDTRGVSLMSVLVHMGSQIWIVDLDLIQDPNGSVQLVEQKSRVVDLPFSGAFLCRREWFVNATPPSFTLFNAHTSRVYRLEVPAPDYTLMSYSFSGTSHLVAVYHSHWDETKATLLAIYSLPSGDKTLQSDSDRLECTFRVDTPYILSFLKELYPPWYHKRKAGASNSPPTSFLKAVQWKEDERVIVQLSITKNQSNGEYQVAIKPVEYPQGVYTEYISQHHTWLVAQSPFYSKQTYLFIRIRYSKEGFIEFDTPVPVRFPWVENNQVYHMTFDEHAGKMYMIPHFVGRERIVHVLDFA